MRIIIFLVLLLSSSVLHGQKEDHQWIFHFGRITDTINFPELVASVLDFNSLPPVGRADVDITLDFKECHGAICDADGLLLYYSNGQSIHLSLIHI